MPDIVCSIPLMSNAGCPGEIRAGNSVHSYERSECRMRSGSPSTPLIGCRTVNPALLVLKLLTASISRSVSIRPPVSARNLKLHSNAPPPTVNRTSIEVSLPFSRTAILGFSCGMVIQSGSLTGQKIPRTTSLPFQLIARTVSALNSNDRSPIFKLRDSSCGFAQPNMIALPSTEAILLPPFGNSIESRVRGKAESTRHCLERRKG